MRTSLVLLILLGAVQLMAQGRVNYYLNGELIPVERISLINAKNVEGIKIIKETDPAGYFITTKKIVYFNYDEIKKIAKVSINDQPEIIIDTEKYLNKENILIDKSLIRKIKLITNSSDNANAIFIKTTLYKRKIIEKNTSNPRIVIRGECCSQIFSSPKGLQPRKL